ncbi:MAG: maltose ABC transporter substrate-binding protein [Chloroflexota bacterium]
MKSIFKITLFLAAVALMAVLSVSNHIATSVVTAATADASAATVAPTVTPTPLPSVEGTLTIWVNPERQAIIEAAGKDFSAKYNVPVRVQTMNFGDIRTNFNIAAPAGNGPDIIAGANDWIGELYSNGLLATVDLADKVKSFDPVAVQAFTYDGKTVGVPYQVEAVAMFYNKDLVPTPPTTWDETQAVATKLQADKKADQGFAFTVTGELYGHYGLLTSYGGGVFGRDAQGGYDAKQVIMDNAGSIQAATELDKLVKAGVLKDGVTYDVAKDLFLKGRLAMWVNGPWELDNIRKSGINFGIAVIPAGTEKAHPFVGVQGFMVSKLSKNALLAQAFVSEFLATDDTMLKLYQAQFGVPAWLPTRTKVTNPDIDAFSASIANGDPLPGIPAMASVWTLSNNALNLVYQQKAAPDAAMKDASASLRDLIAKAK